MPATDCLLKAEGSGNDFVLGLGSWAGRLRDSPDLVARLCDRRRGVGADGVVALSPVSEQRVEMRYRNADGSLAMFCANATRCAARTASGLLGLDSQLEVATDWAVIPAEVRGDQVALGLPPPEEPFRAVQLEAAGKVWSLNLCTVGVPHAVISDLGEIGKLDLESLGPLLAHHPELGPCGQNIDLTEVMPDQRLRVRTFERGVEAETLSCGSGVVASALHHLQVSGKDRVEVVTAGGDCLLVELVDEPDRPIRLVGPARLVAVIEPLDDWLASGLPGLGPDDQSTSASQGASSGVRAASVKPA